MAEKGRGLFRSKRPQVALDELGGRADGGLAIIDSEGNTIHVTPARVAAAMRYFSARVQLQDDEIPNKVALTSAVHAEGVTYVTRSLASVLGYDTERTIAVLDLNWRRPESADGEVEPYGIAAVVDNQLPLEDAIMPTANPRVSLVPAGAVPLARRPALSGSEALGAVIGQLGERFDHLLIDLPPVLMSSDALQLSVFADAFVLVVRQGVTPQAQVESALEELRGAEPLGVVLNRFETKIPRRLRRLVGT